MSGDERIVEVDGIRYTARVVGPAPWNRRAPVWKFWKSGPDLSDPLTAEIIEFEGHPLSLRSRPQTAIRFGTLHSISEENLAALVRRALQSAQHPPGADMVALTRGDQRLVIDWGIWNSLCALLLACGYGMEYEPGEPQVTERDAQALGRLLGSLAQHDSRSTETWLSAGLRDELVEFVSDGAFFLVDIG